jgi:hypothetical protein
MVQGYPGSVNAIDDKKSIRFRNGDSCVSTAVPKFWFDGVGRHLAPWEVDVKVGAGEASVKFFSLFDRTESDHRANLQRWSPY